ncbi:MAG TPA: hypothetical protein VLA93_16125 [Pyrinomonadaceae bacterium]|nr:hypothetical protein [Pyrinomonadaceae bacterium]
MKQFKLTKCVLPAALLILSAAIFTCAQDTRKNQRPPQATETPAKTDAPPQNGDATEYTYEFSQPNFHINHVAIEHNQSGKGKIKFTRKNEEAEVVEPFQLSAAATARVLGLWDALKFLESNKDYQSSQHYAHLGVMRIGMKRGEQKRVAQFDWTHDSAAADLVAEYRRAADQAIMVFDLEIARENQPLNAPKLMEGLESLLRRNALSDPKQLLPLLTDLSTDERVPLIARNHAQRLIKQIQK